MLPIEKEYPLLNRHPEVKELFIAFRQMIQRTQRPPEETILYDEDVMKILGICRRTLETRKTQKQIPFHDCPGQRDYFLLSDLLEYLRKYRVESVDNQRRI